MNPNITFETAMKRLEKIVEKLESGELSLEKSLELFEEGSALSAHCYQKLQQAEQKLRQIEELE